MAHDVERFSRWAPTYDRHFLQRLVFEPVQKTVLQLASSEVPDPQTILDIGCGTGRLLRSAADRFPNATLEGVDPAEGMVEHAKATNSSDRVNFRRGTAEDLPFPDSQFDLAFSTMTFHHWTDQTKGAAEVARVLKPAGRWVLADVVVTGAFKYIRRLLRLKQFPERTELDATLASAGLTIVAERRVQRRISVLVIARAG